MKNLLFIILYTVYSFQAYSQNFYPAGGSQNCQIKTPVDIDSGHERIKNTLASGPPIVRIAYIIPSNRVPQDNYKQNLQFAVELAQMWYRNNMQANGFGPKTFIYETEEGTTRPKIHLVNAEQTDTYLRGNDAYELFENTKNAAKSAGLSIDADGEVWVLVPETILQNPDGSFIGGMALGSGGGSGNNPGLAQFSSTIIQLFNPQMILTDTPYAGQYMPQWGPYPLVNEVSFVWFEGPTWSSVASSWLGALCHEMGHAFGLNHDMRHDNNFFGGLMGNGLRGMRGSLFPELFPTDYTRLEYGSALQLNRSHYFNRDKIVNTAPNLSILTSGTVAPDNGLLNIRFTAYDADSIAYAQLTNASGDQIDETVFNSTDVDATFKTPYYTSGATGSFTVTVCDKQGNRTRYNTYITVPNGFNQAPKAFLRILYPNAPSSSGSTFFDASSTTDPDYDSFTTEFDFNNDGIFDTPPLNSLSTSYTIPQNGPYLSRIRVTDSHGASFISSPVGGNYGKNCGIDSPVINGLNKICPGASVVLTASTCYGTLSWSTGATTQSITVNPVVSTAYTVSCSYACPNLISQPFLVNVFPDNSSLTGVVQSGLQKSAQTITSAQTLSTPSNVIYSTVRSITLLPGFKAEKGNTFSTLLQSCSYPIANADNASVLMNISRTINILSNDFNADGTPVTDLTLVILPAIVTNPAKGKVIVNADGTITYSSYGGASGTDTFSYSICNKNNNAQCSVGTVTITLQDFVNPIQNARFETAVDFSTAPWQKAGWKVPQAVFSWLSGQGRNNSGCIKMFSGFTPDNVQTNDVYVYQTVTLNPNTNYTFRAWVKTENVSPVSGKGASLALVNGSARPPTSIGLNGTNDWTLLFLNFNSGSTGVVTISCRLGYTNADSSGSAYFDDLTIVPQ